jgi:hypothetical protein
MLAAQVPSPGCTPDVPLLDLRRVTPISLTTGAVRFELVVVDQARRCWVLASSSPVSIGVTAAFEGWCATRTPLLMWVESIDHAHVYGPHTRVTGLSLRAGRERSVRDMRA